MKEYLTKQRKTLTALFHEHLGCKLSIDDILRDLPDDAQLSLSTIYRNLDKMTQEGLLEKTLSPESRKALYQYIECEKCCDRIHLRCEKCGKLMHMENKSEESDLAALLEKNGFELDEHATVLIGVCKDCK